MSSTGRGTKRRKKDAYYTPEWCVKRLIEDPDLPFDISGLFLEPSAGHGDIIRAVDSSAIDWVACDIRKKCRTPLEEISGNVVIGDFRQQEARLKAIAKSYGKDRFDVAFTNPPFSIAEDFMSQCMKLAHYTCFLLRLNYLGSKARCSFLRMFPPDVFVLPNRPSYTNDGKTDSTEYAWFIWPAHARSTGLLKILKKTTNL